MREVERYGNILWHHFHERHKNVQNGKNAFFLILKRFDMGWRGVWMKERALEQMIYFDVLFFIHYVLYKMLKNAFSALEQTFHHELFISAKKPIRDNFFSEHTC